MRNPHAERSAKRFASLFVTTLLLLDLFAPAAYADGMTPAPTGSSGSSVSSLPPVADCAVYSISAEDREKLWKQTMGFLPTEINDLSQQAAAANTKNGLVGSFTNPITTIPSPQAGLPGFATPAPWSSAAGYPQLGDARVIDAAGLMGVDPVKMITDLCGTNAGCVDYYIENGQLKPASTIPVVYVKAYAEKKAKGGGDKVVKQLRDLGLLPGSSNELNLPTPTPDPYNNLKIALPGMDVGANEYALNELAKEQKINPNSCLIGNKIQGRVSYAAVLDDDLFYGALTKAAVTGLIDNPSRDLYATPIPPAIPTVSTPPYKDAAAKIKATNFDYDINSPTNQHFTANSMLGYLTLNGGSNLLIPSFYEKWLIDAKKLNDAQFYFSMVSGFAATSFSKSLSGLIKTRETDLARAHKEFESMSRLTGGDHSGVGSAYNSWANMMTIAGERGSEVVHEVANGEIALKSASYLNEAFSKAKNVAAANVGASVILGLGWAGPARLLYEINSGLVMQVNQGRGNDQYLKMMANKQVGKEFRKATSIFGSGRIQEFIAKFTGGPFTPEEAFQVGPLYFINYPNPSDSSPFIGDSVTNIQPIVEGVEFANGSVDQQASGYAVQTSWKGSSFAVNFEDLRYSTDRKFASLPFMTNKLIPKPNVNQRVNAEAFKILGALAIPLVMSRAESIGRMLAVASALKGFEYTVELPDSTELKKLECKKEELDRLVERYRFWADTCPKLQFGATVVVNSMPGAWYLLGTMARQTSIVQRAMLGDAAMMSRLSPTQVGVNFPQFTLVGGVGGGQGGFSYTTEAPLVTAMAGGRLVNYGRLSPITHGLVTGTNPALQMMMRGGMGATEVFNAINPCLIGQISWSSKGLNYVSNCKDSQYKVLAFQPLSEQKQNKTTGVTAKLAPLNNLLSSLNLGQVFSASKAQSTAPALELMREIVNMKLNLNSQTGVVFPTEINYLHVEASAFSVNSRLFETLHGKGCRDYQENYQSGDKTASITMEGLKFYDKNGSLLASFDSYPWKLRALGRLRAQELGRVILPDKIIETKLGCGDAEFLQVDSKSAPSLVASNDCKAAECIRTSLKSITGRSVGNDLLPFLGRISSVDTDAGMATFNDGLIRFTLVTGKPLTDRGNVSLTDDYDLINVTETLDNIRGLTPGAPGINPAQQPPIPSAMPKSPGKTNVVDTSSPDEQTLSNKSRTYLNDNFKYFNGWLDYGNLTSGDVPELFKGYLFQGRDNPTYSDDYKMKVGSPYKPGNELVSPSLDSLASTGSTAGSRIVVDGNGNVFMEGSGAGASGSVNIGVLRTIIGEKGKIEFDETDGRLIVYVYTLATELASNVNKIQTRAVKNKVGNTTVPAIQFDAGEKTGLDSTFRDALKLIQGNGTGGMQSWEDDNHLFYLTKNDAGEDVLRVVDKKTGEMSEYKLTGDPYRDDQGRIVVPTDQGNFKFWFDKDPATGAPILHAEGPGLTDLAAALVAARGQNGIMTFNPSTGAISIYNGQDIPLSPEFAKKGITFTGDAEGQTRGIPQENLFGQARLGSAGSTGDSDKQQPIVLPSWPENAFASALMLAAVLGLALFIRLKKRAFSF